MPRDAIAGWLDFGAFQEAVLPPSLRRPSSSTRLRLRGGEVVVQRAEYAGLLGLLTGIRTPDASYLADVDDGLYAARYLRAWQFEATVSSALRDRYGSAWWRTPTPGIPAGHLARRTGTIGGGRGCPARV